MKLIGDKPPGIVTKRSGLIKNWSFSKLMKYQKCPYSVYLEKVGGTRAQSEAAKRGEEMHSLCERYIFGELDKVPKVIEKQTDSLNECREAYSEGIADVEQEWAIDENWSEVPWKDEEVWGRAKLDVGIQESPSSYVCIDWKSGKKHGNEMKHIMQLQNYALYVFFRYPEVELFTGMMKYLDQKASLKKQWTREQAMTILLPKWDRAATAMTTATDFPARPSASRCRYCDVKEVCEFAVND